MDWNEILHELLYVIIVIVIPLLIKYVVAYLNVKTKEYADQLSNDTLRKYVEDANDIIATIVLSVSQTYVDVMKKAGKFTPEAQETAKKMAVEQAKQMISQASRNAIITMYNDFDNYINNQIEALVRATKIETPV